jgi:hypothetical protein
MTSKGYGVARVPCGSCPYRQDVLSGLWEATEYDKLPAYDGPTWGQAMSLFLCHQRTGNLCAGWLACHDPHELLALRLHHRSVDPAVYDYETDIPVFNSGAEAREHGMRNIKRPGATAKRMIAGLVRKQEIAK